MRFLPIVWFTLQKRMEKEFFFFKSLKLRIKWSQICLFWFLGLLLYVVNHKEAFSLELSLCNSCGFLPIQDIHSFIWWFCSAGRRVNLFAGHVSVSICLSVRWNFTAQELVKNEFHVKVHNLKICGCIWNWEVYFISFYQKKIRMLSPSFCEKDTSLMKLHDPLFTQFNVF